MVLRAVVQSGFGAAADVLSLEEVERPPIGATDILVRVKAVGIAKGNWLITHGLPYIARPAYGLRGPKQRVAGLQFAGVIAELGKSVDGFSLGDPVFGSHEGALAELVAVPGEALVSMPPEVSFEQAATAPISGQAALQAIRDGGRVQPGQRVLVMGASGGVGSFAVQIAKAFGAEVVGVASTRHLAMVRELGADHVLDYTQEDPTAGPACDVIIDLAGNRPVSRLRRALVPAGTLVIVGGTGGRWTMGFGRTIGGMLLSPFVRQRIVGLLSRQHHGDLAVLARLMGSGKLAPVVQATYPAARVAEAVEAAGASRGAGTIVVTF